MKETVEARYLQKDENGANILDEAGANTYNSVSVEYDFGDDLDSSVELCGAEVVHSQFKSAAKVALQGIIRGKLKAGNTPDQIQTSVDAWKPGMVADRTQVDPATAIMNAFGTWSDEKKAEFLQKLGVGAEE